MTGVASMLWALVKAPRIQSSIDTITNNIGSLAFKYRTKCCMQSMTGVASMLWALVEAPPPTVPAQLNPD